MGLFTNVAARMIYASYFVDRAARKFESLRTHLVLGLASETFLQTYGRVAFGNNRAYIAGDTGFRSGLFPWELAVLDRFFPPPPARLLIGGAGGGREVFPLLERGYQVVAFEPSVSLADSLLRNTPPEHRAQLEARVGRYEDLPLLGATNGLPPLDLRQQPPFDAAILGWCSFSHVTTDAARVDALRRCAALTRGPILISYFYTDPYTLDPNAGGWLAGRTARWGASMFSPNVGYCRLLSDDDVKRMAEQAGLEVVFLEREKAWPHAILRAKPQM
jgi:hypothetical protein